MESFSQFIEQQRQVGTVESAGGFTLAIEKARDKLGKHSLARPEEYILKVVQCGVLMQAQKLHITFTRTSVLIYFEASGENHSLSVESLTQALLNPLEESNRARGHLALALCAMAGQSPQELMWGDWDDEGTSLLLSLGRNRSELFRDVPFPRTTGLPKGQRFHLLYMVKDSSSRLPLNLTAAEAALLKERCSLAPVEIEVNNRLLTAQLPIQHSKSDPVSQQTSLYIGSAKFVIAPPNVLHARVGQVETPSDTPLPSGLRPLLNAHPPALFVDCPSHWTLPLRSDIRFQELYLVPSYLYGTSQIYAVKDGVLLNPLDVHDAGGGATAVLCGKHLKTDLTGLQLVKDDECARLTERCIEVWKTMITEYVDSKPPIYHAGTFSPGEDLIYYAFGCCLLAPFGHLVKAILDYATQAEKRREVQCKRFQRQLENRKNWLAYFRTEG